MKSRAGNDQMMIRAESLKALDSMLEAIMALKYLSSSLPRSAAEKAYLSWRNALVAFLLFNRKSVADTVSDTNLYATLIYVDDENDIGKLSEVAEDLGLLGASYLTKLACQLREYHRKGLKGVRHPYYSDDQASSDTVIVVSEAAKVIKKLRGSEAWDSNLEKWYSLLKNEIEKVLGEAP